MNKWNYVDDYNFWHAQKTSHSPVVTKDITADIAIVGGGMAGLSAAHRFNQLGASVVVLEQHFCGAGASGKSSGFITPNSELGLSSLIKHQGPKSAHTLWEFVSSGVEIIRNNIANNAFECDYQEQETLVLATSKRKFKSDILTEYTARKQLQYPSTLYQADEVTSVIGSSAYYGGIQYPGSFSINSFHYCQAMKKLLQEQGVTIYEDTPVLEVGNKKAKTLHATVHAKHIVICADRFIPNLGKLTSDIYQAQTFIIVSVPLSTQTLQSLFPQKPMLAWDTDIIYQYFRVIGNNRLLIGGGSLLSTFASHAEHGNHHMFKKLTNYVSQHFPELNINFEYMWPGLIGISKDLLPIAGQDPHDSSLYYIGAATGLPWAAALGTYSADALLKNRSDMNDFFNPQRKFIIPQALQRIMGTRLSFALSNYYAAQW